VFGLVYSLELLLECTWAETYDGEMGDLFVHQLDQR